MSPPVTYDTRHATINTPLAREESAANITITTRALPRLLRARHTRAAVAACGVYGAAAEKSTVAHAQRQARRVRALSSTNITRMLIGLRRYVRHAMLVL